MIEINGTFRDKPEHGCKRTTKAARKAVQSLFVAPCPRGGAVLEYHDRGLDFDVWFKPTGQVEMVCISPAPRTGPFARKPMPKRKA